MKTDCDSQEKGDCYPKLSRCKYKIAAFILTPLFIAAFISIVSLRATIYSRPRDFDFHQVLTRIIKIFTQNINRKPPIAPPKIRMIPIESAIDTYLLNTGSYPRTLYDLVADLGIRGWAGPYLKPSQLLDPWDRPYIYILYSNGYRLKSYGKDGKPGGEGANADIYNN
jgi:general secretion pathway protein G